MRLDDSDLPTNARFGQVFAVIFAVIGTYALAKGHGQVAVGAVALVIVFVALARVRPKTLEPLNKAWALLGLALGRVFGSLVLALVFFAVLTPMALAFKLFNRDELRLKRGAGDTYWRMREHDQTRSDFRDQF